MMDGTPLHLLIKQHWIGGAQILVTKLLLQIWSIVVA
jgi:hypothetical protein